MIDMSKRVNVYRNLSKPGSQFSVQQAGRVRKYVTEIRMTNVRFKHATERQLDAVRKGPRQVCQWLNGRIDAGSPPDGLVWLRIACDPKKVNGFVLADSSQRVTGAEFLRLDSTGCWAAGIQQ